MTEKSSHNPLKLIGRANRAFTRVVEGPLRELGFAMSQVPVLVTLKKAGALSQAELARLAEVEQSSMAQLLNRMERDGLVERVADPADRRSRLISLTDEAARQLPSGKSVMDAVSRQALAGFSAEEKEQLASLLLRVNANLDAALPRVDG
ncbi:MarR family transcriptional regulator [Paraburkholderia nemoris]|uniref:MarR family winged helix-turn-helix transcriptional regulator n=1 Tax=Paraburkholderia nemoris TaxID=2793076 RepID=UPI0038B6B394